MRFGNEREVRVGRGEVSAMSDVEPPDETDRASEWRLRTERGGGGQRSETHSNSLPMACLVRSSSCFCTSNTRLGGIVHRESWCLHSVHVHVQRPFVSRAATRSRGSLEPRSELTEKDTYAGEKRCCAMADDSGSVWSHGSSLGFLRVNRAMIHRWDLRRQVVRGRLRQIPKRRIRPGDDSA